MGLCYLEFTLHPLEVPRIYSRVWLQSELEEISLMDNTTWTCTTLAPLVISPPNTPTCFLCLHHYSCMLRWLLAPIYWFVYCRAFNNGYFLVVNAQLSLGGPVCSIVFCNYPKFTQQFQAYYMGHSM